MPYSTAEIIFVVHQFSTTPLTVLATLLATSNCCRIKSPSFASIIWAMRDVTYSTDGIRIEASQGPQQATEIKKQNLEKTTCCGIGRRRTLDVLGDPHYSQIYMLRLIGILCIVFGCTEIGLGVSLFVFFNNIRSGAWWSTIMVVIAGNVDPFDEHCHKYTNLHLMPSFLDSLILIISFQCQLQFQEFSRYLRTKGIESQLSL